MVNKMANWISLRRKCAACNGTGIYTPTGGSGVPCPYCSGAGYFDSGLEIDTALITDDLMSVCKENNDICNKILEIVEKKELGVEDIKP